VPKDFHLDYDKLEDRPSLPSNGVNAAAIPGGPSNGPPPPPPPPLNGPPPSQSPVMQLGGESVGRQHSPGMPGMGRDDNRPF
jgi:hypothetical protein